MGFDFVVDRTARDKMYPNLSRWSAEPYTPQWRQFGQHWPNVVPLRLQEYCQQHGVDLNFSTTADKLCKPIYYPIALEFFNFEIDYFALIGAKRLSAIRNSEYQILFYYHEGDNPQNIQTRLDRLCDRHGLPYDCYRFVSGNTAADLLPRFAWFSDFELWFWQRNRHVAPVTWHANSRSQQFTVLNRTHKSWRATAMADLWQHSILEHSYWSYPQAQDIDDSENPIEVDSIDNLRLARQQFLAATPVTCDLLNTDQHNDHSLSVEQHFSNAYCNIVIETHWDADQSSGAFLTEKTFKPIKNAQLFVIAGCHGSLAALRKLGYRTFDSVINTDYDQEPNNTQRWLRLRETVQAIQKNLPDIYQQCRAEIEYNQQLFCATKADRLSTLQQKLLNA